MIQRARALAGVPVLLLVLLLFGIQVGAALAQTPDEDDDLVQLDFNDTPLTEIIEVISKLTNKNFIFDERVRGNITIKSPTRITKEQAYAVFESALQVKGFTTVETPGGSLKIIPLRDAKETNIETRLSGFRPANRDHFITQLIPLRYIEAEAIVNTLKPLVSKDANIAAYAPTNTVILTEAASNIRRILAILEAIDVESYKEELAVITIEHADAQTLASQISEIYGADVSSSSPSSSAASRRSRSSRRTSKARTTTPTATGAVRAKVRIITDTRTNALIVLAATDQLNDVRKLIARLDVPVTGGGRIHVYYLQNADATDLAQTLGGLISGRGAPSGGGAAGGGGAQALRAAVSGLAGGITVTADPATNSLIIQSSKEGFDTLSGVIAKLDVERPQVLVEALIIEVDVTDSETLGFSGLVRFINGDTEFSTLIAPSTMGGLAAGGPVGGAVAAGLPLVQRFIQDTRDGPLDSNLNPTGSGQVIETIINAAAADNGTNIISAPHILTMDNEQAEIRIGQNIPIITNRVQSAQGVTNATGALATSVNVERQDIGVTLRVTPHITEGDSLRMEIFQEISAINEGLSGSFDTANTGVPLSQRTIENTVIVKDGETVVIGGLLSEDYQDTVSKVPFLGDIPVLGWAFKTTTRTLRKINLLIFLTPHIIRSPSDMELDTIRKREEFAEASREGLEWSDRERQAEKSRQQDARESGEPYEPRGQNPARIRVLEHEARYPAERIEEITEAKRADAARIEAERLAAADAPRFMVAALVPGGEDEAIRALQNVIDAGHDGTLTTTSLNGGIAFELRIGPYETIGEARQVQGVLGHSQGLSPSIVVVPHAPPGNIP